MNGQNHTPGNSSDTEEQGFSEFIILEDEDGEGESFGARMHAKKAADIPFHVRILCFVIGLFAIVWWMATIVLFLVASLVATLGAYRNPALNARVARRWTSVKSGAAVVTGLGIALFSPQLGLILIFSYFLLQGKDAQKSGWGKILNAQFRDYV